MNDIQLRRVVVDACDGPFGSAIKSSHYSDEGARVIRLGNIGVGFWKDQSKSFLPVEYWKGLDRHHASAGDIVMAGLGDVNNPVGRACVIPEIGPSLVKADCYRLRVDSTQYDPRYLAAYLSSRVGLAQSEQLAEGSTRIRLTLGKALTVRIPDIDIEEQRRIADFLDAETSRIDRISQLQAQVLAKLHERDMASRDAAIDRMYAAGGATQLRRHIWSVDQGVSPQCDAVPAAEGEWGVLKVSSIRPCVFDPTQNKRLPAEIAPSRSSEIRKGDLLIVRANTPELVGSAVVVGEVRDRLLLSDKIFRVRLMAGLMPEFVAEVAAGSRGRAMSAASSNGASQSMANIRFEQVKAWHIPVVDLEAQQRFVDRMVLERERLTGIRRVIERQLNLLDERRQSLISAAVSGQIDVATAGGRNVHSVN